MVFKVTVSRQNVPFSGGKNCRKTEKRLLTPFSSATFSSARKYIVDVGGGLPVILLEIDPADSLIKKSYYYANGEILMQQNGNHTADKYFYLHDRLGSVREVINTSGSVVHHYTYSPFGQTIEESGTFSNPFMFTGQWYDPEIGQYYLRARMYDPQLMRFTAYDPVTGKFEEPMTLHKYLYCTNEPINKIDPTGLWEDGVRYYLRKYQNIQDAYSLSDSQIKGKYDPDITWYGHSDFGNLRGDFDYTKMDNDPITSPDVRRIWKNRDPSFFWGLHFMNLSDSEALVSEAIRTGDSVFFEYAMHMGQDFFSHYNKGYRASGGLDGFGHKNHIKHDPSNPDNPYTKGFSDSGLSSSFNAANDWTKEWEDKWYMYNDPYEWIGAND